MNKLNIYFNISRHDFMGMPAYAKLATVKMKYSGLDNNTLAGKPIYTWKKPVRVKKIDEVHARR